MDFTWLSPLLALLPLVTAAVAIASYRQTRRRDRVTGATDPHLRLTMASTDETDDVDLRCICAPFLGEHLSVPLRVRIRNDGGRSAANLKLVIAAPVRFFSKHDKPFTSSDATGFKASVAEYLPSTFSYACDIAELHPQQSCDVVFRLLLRSTLGSIAINDPCDTGTIIPLAAEDDFLVKAVLYQEHAPAIVREFAFRLHDYGLSSLPDYLHAYNTILAERWERRIAGLNDFRRFLIRKKTPIKRVAMIVWPHEQIYRFTDDTPSRVGEPSTATIALGALYPEMYWVPALGVGLRSSK